MQILLKRYPDKIFLKDEAYIRTSLLETREFPLGRWNDSVETNISYVSDIYVGDSLVAMGASNLK